MRAHVCEFNIWGLLFLIEQCFSIRGVFIEKSYILKKRAMFLYI